MTSKPTVAVGLSGGMDSAMAALLLQEQGYRVIGLTMSIWDDSIPIEEATKSGCFGPGEESDIHDAKAISERLGIEHHVIRLQHEYKENVLAYFCDTYLVGKTPNPCLMCNYRMKFGLLPARAKEQGIHFDYFATGHYVRVVKDPTTGRMLLKRALDDSKDQSYFLSFLRQEQLSGLIFPLGELTKAEVREYARKCGFTELAERQESQDFLEADDHGVLFQDGDIRPGEMVDTSGKVIGQHRGLIYYTIGQRRNLGLSGLPEPYFVVGIDAARNQVIVGPKHLLFTSVCRGVNMNWHIPVPSDEIRATAKIRLQHDAAPCTVKVLPDASCILTFDAEQLSVTPGQGLVIYDGDTVIAGGIIETDDPANPT